MVAKEVRDKLERRKTISQGWKKELSSNKTGKTGRKNKKNGRRKKRERKKRGKKGGEKLRKNG